jgi:predicted nucleotidyltransferase component of viral defense system
MDERFRRQVDLLLRCLPHVAVEDAFALKGGTAINLFLHDLPRLSVDIDLTYLPVRSRPDSLADVAAALQRIADRIHDAVPDARVVAHGDASTGNPTKVAVRRGAAHVKIEVTPVLRGCVYTPDVRSVAPAVEASFGYAEMQVVSIPDLYAGKFVAALDRQHPRDLFDVDRFLSSSDVDDALRAAFIVYLVSHHRPMAEVLRPSHKDISHEFEYGFAGMTAETVDLATLLAARSALIAKLIDDMPEAHRSFLVSFEEGEPDWELLGLPEAAKLPAVRWRQENLDRLSPKRRSALVAQLKAALWP